MPVHLDRLPAKAFRPARPRLWLWLTLLGLCLLAGVVGALLFAPVALREQPARFWALAIGLPMLGWVLLGFARAVVYSGQHGAADGWDDARKADLDRRLRRARRSQQVLAVSLQTALRAPGAAQPVQLVALLGNTAGLKTQPCSITGETARHSRLPGDLSEAPALAALRVMKQLLDDLKPALAQVAETTPLALLLQLDSGAAEKDQREAWQQAWRESAFPQPVTPLEGSGLAALDDWLDQRIADPAMLLVVAVQLAPTALEGAAQVAVGLLLGNRLTQTRLAPIAYLYRPEQERQPAPEHLLYAAQQALLWAPLEPQAVRDTWRAGVDPARDGAVATALAQVALPAQNTSRFHNLDALLGQAGGAAAWLAIAAAAQAAESGAGPQFIFSGDGSAGAGLWGTAVSPAAPISK